VTSIAARSPRRIGPPAIAAPVSAQFETGGIVMATYVNLYKFTEKGMQTIKETTKRFEAAKKAAAQAGVTLKDAYWLQGKYDLVVISEAPDEIAAAAFLLGVAKLGNIRGETLRAFPPAEMEKILAKVS
jgi:uncharacterized protein with GYD domain